MVLLPAQRFGPWRRLTARACTTSATALGAVGFGSSHQPERFNGRLTRLLNLVGIDVAISVEQLSGRDTTGPQRRWFDLRTSGVMLNQSPLCCFEATAETIAFSFDLTQLPAVFRRFSISGCSILISRRRHRVSD